MNPQPSRILTLLTDFGLQDVYVGVMKGVIAQIAPDLNVVDLTHQLAPQDLAAARFGLLNAVPYFPDGTVHVAVVDPGVGSRRRAIAVQFTHEFGNGFLVGPDNGLFSGVLEQYGAIAAVELTQSNYWLTPTPSTTFHGRDIFAPVGAHLAGGVPLAELGTAIPLRGSAANASETLIQFPLPPCTVTPAQIEGCIQYIDRFGNLVTNISCDRIPAKPWFVTIPQPSPNPGQEASIQPHPHLKIPSHQTYSDSKPGTLLALIGSHGWVEIAVNQGSAQDRLGLHWGDTIIIIAG